MPPKDVERMANSIDPDQTALLIRIYTVCSDIHVPIFKIFTVFIKMFWMDKWLLFNSILVISVRWVGDNERLCAMEPCLKGIWVFD